ncbi:hypothetical protein MKW98_026811 [Papaver atlanticum]|uniref:Protein kinase domain-containing protein n=1 Tax=Papaver atlanticum TaxID=357466 RepID=A0AAD4S0Z6_9MAGN|nr:hypothetical protein MKW98_026811 [Papaver atlanticum]
MQIALALMFIHERGIAHLDVKPDNIYVKNGVYKLGDFGVAILLDKSLPIEERDAHYMPQEILNDNYDYLDKFQNLVKELTCLCKNQLDLFHNVTADRSKRAKQVQRLISLVHLVTKENGGLPHTNEIFNEIKKGNTKVPETEHSEGPSTSEKEYSGVLDRITEMVEGPY